MARITGIRKERLREIIARGPVPISFTPAWEKKNIFRATTIQDNLSTPIRPRSLKAPKPIPQQIKRSATVRTNDNPTELGKASPRFHDPVGNAFRARTEFKPDKGFDPLWIGYPDTDTEIGDGQPDGDLWLFDARMRDAVLQFVSMSNQNRDRGFKPEEKPSPIIPWACVACSPVQRVGKLAKASATKPISRTLPWRDYLSRCQFHHVLASLPDTAPVTPRPLQKALRPCPLPKVIPLPVHDRIAALGLPIGYPSAKDARHAVKRSPAPVVVAVTKTDQSTHLAADPNAVITFEAMPWTSVTRKRLWERVPIQSRSAKKRGFRYIPKKPHTAIMMPFS